MRIGFCLALLVGVLFASNAEAYQPQYRYLGGDRSLTFMTTQASGVEEPALAPQDASPSFGGGSGGTYRMSIDAGIAENDVSGTVRIDQTIANVVTLGTDVDFDNNLSIKSDSAVRIGGKLQLGGFSLEVAYQDMSFTSDYATGTITIFGRTIDVSQPTRSEIDMPYLQAKLGFRLNEPDPDNGDWFAWGLGVGVHYFDFSMSVKATDAGALPVDEEESAPVPLPTLGLLFGIYPSSQVSIEVTAWALVVPEIAGVEGSIFDVNVVGKYYVTRWLSVGARAGFVQLSLKADVDEGDNRLVGDFDITTFQIGGVVGLSF